MPALRLPPGLKFHAFMTHDWGVDELGRPNHDRVKRAHIYFKSRGLLPWFDEEEMQGADNRALMAALMPCDRAS